MADTYRIFIRKLSTIDEKPYITALKNLVEHLNDNDDASETTTIDLEHDMGLAGGFE